MLYRQCSTVLNAAAMVVRFTVSGSTQLVRKAALAGWSVSCFLVSEFVRALFTYLVVIKVLQQQQLQV